MSLDRCLPDLVAKGAIDQARADEVGSLYGELKQQFRRQFGDQAAAAMATDATLEALDRAALLKRRRAGLQAAAQKDALRAMDAFGGGRDPGKPIDPRAGPAFFDKDERAPYSNVEARRKAVKATAHGMIDGLLQRFHADITGRLRNRAELDDVVRALFGEATGSDAARELAGAWTDAAEMLRQRFNAAGGDIGKIERWGLPQSHDSRAVRRVGYAEWRDFIAPKLDRARMIDRRTGQPFGDEALELALRDTYEAIRTDGWSRQTPGQAGRGAMANRHSDPRFLIFKSTDDWGAYAERFGSGTAFDAMMGHIDTMAREIAAMEILGPNPAATVGWLKDVIEKSAATDTAPDSKAPDAAFAARRQIDRLWNEYTGAQLRPENRALALGFSSLRSFQTAAKLGSATLSAVTDLGFQMSARHYNGLPAATIMGDYLKLLRPGSVEDQRLAVRMGLIAEEWSNHVASQQRYLTEELTGEVSRRLAEGVLKASGLNRWTQAGRWAFGMQFVNTITGEAGKSFDALDPAFRAMLERNGIASDGWDIIRATTPRRERGQDWIFPQDIADARVRDRLMETILTEMDMAVPVASLKTRALINSVAPRGTWHGEILKSAFLFKSFGISVMLDQMHRIMQQSAGNAARYAGGLIIGTTLLGGLALQLKALAGGQDPRDASKPEFWGAAALQGGGFGIFGDFLQSQTNRFDGGFAQTLAGPLVQDAQGLVDIAKTKRPAWQAVRQLRQSLPGGSLWYLKLGMDRLVTDQIQQEIDPNYRAAWRRMEKRASEQGTRYWWAPGETAPERAPDLGNALGETVQ